jgi:hypothetical protein
VAVGCADCTPDKQYRDLADSTAGNGLPPLNAARGLAAVCSFGPKLILRAVAKHAPNSAESSNLIGSDTQSSRNLLMNVVPAKKAQTSRSLDLRLRLQALNHDR